jgi:trehalose/maltose hydrolase-like predicted phosphorylase
MRHYAGLELGAKGARLSPDLPRRLRGLRFRFQYRGRWYDVEMTRQRVRVAVDDVGPDVEIEIGGHLCRVPAGTAIEVELESSES